MDRREDEGRERTCIKFGLLPANIQSMVKTNAARPKMTGINAVGRSILAKGVWTDFECAGASCYGSSSASIRGIEKKWQK